MSTETPCPCLFCRIERERDFSCRENRALGIEEMVQDRGYRWRVFVSPGRLVEFLNNNNVSVVDICGKPARMCSVVYTLIYREG